MMGRRLEAFYPKVPLVLNTALGIAIMSYDGQLFFGLLGDYDALADLDALAADLDAAIRELAAAAGVRAAPKRRAARKPAGPRVKRALRARDRRSRRGGLPGADHRPRVARLQPRCSGTAGPGMLEPDRGSQRVDGRAADARLPRRRAADLRPAPRRARPGATATS